MNFRLNNYAVFATLMVVLSLISGPSLQAISTLSGFVRDSNGAPVVGADLDFIDIVTGAKLITPSDNTDINGFYSVTLLNSTFYNVTFAPPPGSNLMGRRFNNFDLTVNRSLDIVLSTGKVIQGTIRDSLGNPVGDVDFDGDNFTLGRIFTPDDNSDFFFGRYWAVVPPGTYRLRYDPPPGSFLRGFQINSVDIVNDTVINIILQNGNILSGQVSDISGNGISGVDIDLRDIDSGEKVFISKNTTDSLGQYRVVLPSGLFNLRFAPSSGSRFIGVNIDSFAIFSDIMINQTLQQGVLLTTLVTDSLGAPIVKADIDVKLQSTGAKLFTPNDKTDITGSATVAIPTGIYTVQVDPPLGSLFDQVIVNNVIIDGDTTMFFVLPELPRVTLSCRVENIAGVGIADIDIDLVRVSTGTKLFLTGNKTDLTGAFVTAAPVGVHNVLISPPAGSRFVAKTINSVLVNVDTVWSPIVLDSGIQVTIFVNDVFGAPIDGGDIDMIDELTFSKAFTPHDNINSQGVAMVTVSAGRYTVTAAPLAGSSFREASIVGVNISADTTLTIVLPLVRSPEAGQNFVLEQNYPNPFNSSSIIRYTLLSASNVSVTIYNILGQEVTVLLDGFQAAGQDIELMWNGADQRGNHVAAGVYFYRLRTPTGSQTKKMTIVR